MPSAVRPTVAFLCLVAISAATGVAHAQTKPAPAAPPPPVSADPTVTTAAFGDWTLRCEAQADKGQRICEAVQTVQLQGERSPVAQIAFGRGGTTEPVKLVVVLPVNVLFPSAVAIGVGDKDPAAVQLAWHRCLPVGCFADALAPAEAVKRWRGETGQGRIGFKDAAGRDIALPISFRGLAQALDALAKS